METLEWTTDPPTRPGKYLRVNAGHRVSVHTCWEMEGRLWVDWGWDGEGAGYVELDHPNLRGWWWFHVPPVPKFESYPVEIAREPAHA